MYESFTKDDSVQSSSPRNSKQEIFADNNISTEKIDKALPAIASKVRDWLQN